MKKLLLITLSVLCVSFSFAQKPYDNKETTSGKIYRAVYHELDVKFPTIGKGLAFSNMYHKIREEINGSKSTFAYEFYGDYDRGARVSFNATDLSNLIIALEQIYQDWTNNKGGESMYYASNGFMIGYDTAAYKKWQIKLSPNEQSEEIKPDKIPEVISVLKTALSKMQELSN